MKSIKKDIIGKIILNLSFEALIISVKDNTIEENQNESKEKKLNGFGRSEFEALRQAVLNIFDYLMNNDNVFHKIREVIKVLVKFIF